MAAPDYHDLDTRLASLMRSAQTGDAEAYVTLMQELAIRVRRMVRRRRAFLEDADVEDLVQDVLLSVHVVRATYDATRPFLPWLLAITRNRLVDAARRHTRHAAREVIIEDLDVTFPPNTRIPWRRPAIRSRSRMRSPACRLASEAPLNC